jgi:hypothetical protein
MRLEIVTTTEIRPISQPPHGLKAVAFDFRAFQAGDRHCEVAEILSSWIHPNDKHSPQDLKVNERFENSAFL